jgi:hypothetical protein
VKANSVAAAVAFAFVLLQAKAALLEHVQIHGMLAVPHEHLRAALDLPPSSKLDSPERTLALKKVRASGSGRGCVSEMQKRSAAPGLLESEGARQHLRTLALKKVRDGTRCFRQGAKLAGMFCCELPSRASLLGITVV